MSVSTASEPELSHTTASATTVSASLVWFSFLVALAALLGSLWLSIGMGLKACPLCLYQRTFVMGVVAVLGVGLLTGTQHRSVLSLLALPMVVAGVGVAVFHEYLELTGKLECPAGVMGIGTAPQQSFVVLIVLLVLVIVGIVRLYKSASVGAVVLGLLLAVGSVVSAPPMPPAPTKAYTTPLDMCRPPFHQQ